MNFQSFVNFGKASNLSVGLNVVVNEKFEFLCSYCVLKKEKHSVFLVKSGHGAKSFPDVEAEIIQYLIEGVRVHINLITSELLSKSLNAPLGDLVQDSKILFPFLQMDEMFIQRFNNGENCFCTVVRKDVLQNVLPIGGRLGWVQSVSLGPFILSALEKFIPNGTFSSYDFELRKNEEQLLFIPSESNNIELTLEIGNKKMDGEDVLAYASALAVFVPTDNLLSSSLPFVDNERLKFNNWKDVYRVVKFATLTTLFLLCINALSYLSLQRQIVKLEESISFSAVNGHENREFNSTIKNLVHVYQGLGWKSNIQPLYYIDQIAQTIPDDLQLTKLQVGVPDEEQIRNHKMNFFVANRIEIAGLAKTPLAFDAWVREVEGLSWVVKISGRAYRFDDKLGKGVFAVIIETDGALDR